MLAKGAHFLAREQVNVGIHPHFVAASVLGACPTQSGLTLVFRLIALSWRLMRGGGLEQPVPDSGDEQRIFKGPPQSEEPLLLISESCFRQPFG